MSDAAFTTNLGRRAFRKDDFVGFKFDMEIVDGVRSSMSASVMDFPFTSHSTGMRRPLMKRLWWGERNRSRRGY